MPTDYRHTDKHFRLVMTLHWQTDRRTDATKYIISLASQSIIKCSDLGLIGIILTICGYLKFGIHCNLFCIFCKLSYGVCSRLKNCKQENVQSDKTHLTFGKLATAVSVFYNIWSENEKHVCSLHKYMHVLIIWPLKITLLLLGLHDKDDKQWKVFIWDIQVGICTHTQYTPS